MFEQMLRQIIREELSAAMRNIPQYVDQDTEKIVNFRHTDNTVVRSVRKVR